jgi:hypothetical protein
MRLSFIAFAFHLAIATAGAAEQGIPITTPELRGAVQPQIAVSLEGVTHVVFGKDNAIYYTRSGGSAAFDRPTRVAEVDQLALRMRRGPRIAASDSRVLITAISRADGNLYAWISADGGKTFRKEPPLNLTAKSAEEGMHALASNGHGHVAVVWNDNREKKMEVWARFSTDGGETWGEERVVYSAPSGPICPCCHPSVAFAPNGEIAVMWRNALNGSRDMFIRTTGDFGKTFSPAQKLGEGTWKLEGCPMDGGNLTFTPEGKWITTWRREGTLYTAPIGAPEERLGEGKQPVIAYAGDERFLFWEQNGALMMQRGEGQSEILAAQGAEPSAVGHGLEVTVAWEAGAAGADGLCVAHFSRSPKRGASIQPAPQAPPAAQAP